MIIALCGPQGASAGCGKDTVADILVAEHGFNKVAFADPLRAMALALDPIVHVAEWSGKEFRLSEIVHIDGWDKAKREYPEVRRTLQRFGTEVIRDFVGKNFWVDYALKKMAAEPGDWVVTDCRFPNEADAIINLCCNQGCVIRVVRPGLEPLPGGHASEAGIPEDLVDYTLKNDNDLVRLKHRVEDMLHWIEENS